jgi:hypothetical protein
MIDAESRPATQVRKTIKKDKTRPKVGLALLPRQFLSY